MNQEKETSQEEIFEVESVLGVLRYLEMRAFLSGNQNYIPGFRFAELLILQLEEDNKHKRQVGLSQTIEQIFFQIKSECINNIIQERSQNEKDKK